MAYEKPISTALRLEISLGTVDGKEVKKSVTVSRINAAASADDLFKTAEALGTLLQYQVTGVRKSETDMISA
jgi:hypothetical protein